MTYVLQDEDGQIGDSWSVSAGLDYPAVGPEHAHLKETGRATYVGATDAEALARLCRARPRRGDHSRLRIRPRRRQALKLAEAATRDTILLVGLSGRGDKDMAEAERLLGL